MYHLLLKTFYTSWNRVTVTNAVLNAWKVTLLCSSPLTKGGLPFVVHM